MSCQNFVVKMEQLSAPEQKIALEKFEDDEITSDMIEAASKLFSENYGIWGPLAEENMGPFAKAGRRVRMNATRLRSQCLPDDSRNCLVRGSVNDVLTGYVFASRWIYEGRNICWITQLCVSSSFRRLGLATRLLKELREGENDRGFALLSSHPGAILAALRAFGRGPTDIDHDMSRKHARDIMTSSPVEYVRNAVLHGSVFEQNVTDGTVSCADTKFFVDHTEVLEALENFKDKNAHWPYGDLPDGHEFLVIVKGEAPDATSRQGQHSSSF